MPFTFGRASSPFDARHSSRREPRGPCVDIFFAACAVAVEGADPASSSMVSRVGSIYVKVSRENNKSERKGDGVSSVR